MFDISGLRNQGHSVSQYAGSAKQGYFGNEYNEAVYDRVRLASDGSYGNAHGADYAELLYQGGS